VNAGTISEEAAIRMRKSLYEFTWTTTFVLVLLFILAGVSLCAADEPAGQKGQLSKEDIAKLAQNPVADVISIPLQNNFNYNYGPHNGNQYVGNVQPVIPFSLTENWNVITRTIVPVIHQPRLAPDYGDTWGMGDIQFTTFLAPVKPTGGIIWGVGPIVQFPSGTDNSTTAGKWAAGPSAVALRMDGPWVYGALVNYLSSFTGQEDRGAVSQWTVQPFMNYNLPDGWYLTTSPIMTANMMAEGSQQWTVPLGGGVGKIVHLGKLPLNVQLQGFYNVAHPDIGPEWSVRFTVQMMLPKSIF